LTLPASYPLILSQFEVKTGCHSSMSVQTTASRFVNWLLLLLLIVVGDANARALFPQLPRNLDTKEHSWALIIPISPISILPGRIILIDFLRRNQDGKMMQDPGPVPQTA
jgi:hypothetical protein